MTLSSSRNAVNNSSACTIKRFPSSRCASATKIVRPLESIAETQPNSNLLCSDCQRWSPSTSYNSAFGWTDLLGDSHGRSWEALRTSLAVSGGRCAKAMRATSSALCRLCSAICRFRLSCSAPVWPICSPKKAPTRVPVTLSARETNIEQSGYRIRLNSSGGQTCRITVDIRIEANTLSSQQLRSCFRVLLNASRVSAIASRGSSVNREAKL